MPGGFQVHQAASLNKIYSSHQPGQPVDGYDPPAVLQLFAGALGASPPKHHSPCGLKKGCRTILLERLNCLSVKHAAVPEPFAFPFLGEVLVENEETQPMGVGQCWLKLPNACSKRRQKVSFFRDAVVHCC